MDWLVVVLRWCIRCSRFVHDQISTGKMLSDQLNSMEILDVLLRWYNQCCSEARSDSRFLTPTQFVHSLFLAPSTRLTWFSSYPGTTRLDNLSHPEQRGYTEVYVCVQWNIRLVLGRAADTLWPNSSSSSLYRHTPPKVACVRRFPWGYHHIIICNFDNLGDNYRIIYSYVAIVLKKTIDYCALHFCRILPALHASSPPRAEAANNKGGLPFTEIPGDVPPPSGLPRGATAPAEAGQEHNGYDKNIPHTQERNGGASEGGGGGGGDAGATSPGDDDKGDGKLGIDLSASFVRLELKDFRGRQALMVGMIVASLKPIF